MKKYKFKIRKSISKRFKIFSKGKIKCKFNNRSHLLTKKDPKKKRRIRSNKIINNLSGKKKIKRMLGLR